MTSGDENTDTDVDAEGGIDEIIPVKEGYREPTPPNSEAPFTDEERVLFVGTCVGAGDPVMLDDGEYCIRLPVSVDVVLGGLYQAKATFRSCPDDDYFAGRLEDVDYVEKLER